MRGRWVRTPWALLAALVMISPGSARGEDPPRAWADIKADNILGHIKVLASDDFEGRGPGTAGEDKTVAYLVDQFKAIGLKPGNPDGRYVQDVPLVGFQATSTSGSIRVGGQSLPLATSEDWVAVSRRSQPEVRVSGSDVVFVGYGVVAPEFGWDDYKGLDVRDKTVVMLVNDPPVPDPSDPAKLDPKAFGGNAMTYYGRWTYKYETASSRGAAACLLVHETGPAGYPYNVVVGSWGRENFDLASPDGNPGRVAVEAWLALPTARKLFEAAGQDFEALKGKAARKDFRPVPLGASASFEVRNQVRKVASKNVVARLEGTDPKLKDETIVYTAHWDHLGRDTFLPGDQIFNGAADNASGTAALLELARGWAVHAEKPRRSILFLAVTAEEKGLLGAKHYAENPLYPTAKTLANINMDVINLWGRTRDIVSVGQGFTTLDDLLADVAKSQNRTVAPDPEPEKGLYYRSDHFEFAKVGVPALNGKGGIDYIDKPEGYGRQKRDEYTQKDYHKVSDEVKPDWDLSGAVEDSRLLFEVGRLVAQGDRYPEWKPGTEFKARRDAALKAAGR
ncbi:M28 family peptidase [Tundrisphaera sp. TA3]|uniref:M28 family metallopeptidase n=1 Tax=Tundrisphaera sp. TA3 TaxID=3435775 RepID=UPI003EBD6697